MVDFLEQHGITLEDVERVEDAYHKAQRLFIDNPLFLQIIEDIEKDLFNQFGSSKKEAADEAYYEVQGLKRILEKIQSIASEYHKVQDLKNNGSKYDYEF